MEENTMITEREVETALQAIFDNIDKLADAKMNLGIQEALLKQIDSELRMKCEGPQKDKDDYALTSPTYGDQVVQVASCVRGVTFCQLQNKANELKIDLYRTQSADHRRLG